MLLLPSLKMHPFKIDLKLVNLVDVMYCIMTNLEEPFVQTTVQFRSKISKEILKYN